MHMPYTANIVARLLTLSTTLLKSTSLATEFHVDSAVPMYSGACVLLSLEKWREKENTE